MLDFFYDTSGKPHAMRHGYASNNNYTYYYYITNLQGDVIRLVDIYGNTAAYYEYDPYGNAIQAAGSHANVNPLRYRGYVYDHDTGFYYLQSRYYDPQTGRFINADVYASTGQGILGNNMFAYCGNNPVAWADFAGYSYHYVLDVDSGKPIDDATIQYLGTGIFCIVLVGTATSQNEETKEEAVADVRTSSEVQHAVYYGIDFYGGTRNVITGSMLFEEAAFWARLTAASGYYSDRAAWGLYTSKADDAMAMAIYLGSTGAVSFDAAKKDHLPHFHTAGRDIFGIYAPSFHIWYG